MTSWPSELVLVSLDVWDDTFSLNATMAFDADDAPGHWHANWGIAVDGGPLHRAAGGGAGGTAPAQCTLYFETALPDDGRELGIFIAPPGRENYRVPLPGEPTLVVPLTAWPPASVRHAATLEGRVPGTRRVDPGPVYAAMEARGVCPERVVPVGVQLGDVGPYDVCVLSIVTWSTCFDLHIGGSGAGPGPTTGRSGHDPYPWIATDDRGGTYEGWYHAGGAGPTWEMEATFAPQIDPAATTLDLTFPHPYDDSGVIRTTVDLS